MMSQMTNGIFAAPGQIAPMPTARPARSQSGQVRLVVTDANGQVLQSWVLKQNKATLGSSDTCNICCNLPGIAPVHALIVTGTRQTFVRSLAGKLSQDGIPASELLLGDNQSYFELAGYRFALVRKETAQARQEQIQNQRMRFALARPLAVSNSAEPKRDPSAEQTTLSAPWVANVIREAIEPLEAQIESLLLPLAEFQAQSLQAQINANRELEEERTRAVEKQRSKNEIEIVNIVAQQSANMEVLTERLSDVNSQLTAIERIIAQDAELNSNAKAETNKVVSVQQTAIEQLQVGMVSVSESIKLLQEQQRAAQSENLSWKNEVQLQLQQLTSAVSDFTDVAQNHQQPEILEAIESLKQTHELAQSEIQRWQVGVQKQLDVLQDKMQENAREDLQEIPTQLASAISEIQAKHEQTLLDLQSWKSELRQEMQELLRAAVQPVATAPQATHTAPSQIDSIHDQPENWPTRLHEPASQTLQNNFIPGTFASTTDVAQASNEAVSWHGYEPVAQEIVSDEMVRNASQQLEHSTHDAAEDYSSMVEQNNVWPTLQVSSEPTVSAQMFGDQWNTSSSNEVLENQAADNTDSSSWNLPEDDHQFSPPKTHAPSELMAFRPSTPVFEHTATTNAETPVNASPEIGLKELFPDANWSSNAEPDFDDAMSTSAPKAQTPLATSASDDLTDSGQPATTKRTESELPSWWTNKVEEASTADAISQANEPTGHEVSLLFREAPQLSQAAAVVENSNQYVAPAEFTESHAPNQPPLTSSMERFVEREKNLRSELIESSATTDEPEFNWDEALSTSSNSNHEAPAFDFHRGSAEQASHEELFFGQQSHPEDARLEPVPITAHSHAPATSHSPTKSGDDEEESVEAYMKNLLARMRGESSDAIPAASSPAPAPVPTAPTRSSPYELRNAMREPVEQGENVEPMDLDSYVPLTNAPEKTKNISALRDLANSNARTAIHKSTRRRTLSGSLMKFAISAIALTVAAALFAINGVTVNIALVATMAALFVALIWGYDGIKSLKPLLQNSLVLQPSETDTEEVDEDDDAQYDH